MTFAVIPILTTYNLQKHKEHAMTHVMVFLKYAHIYVLQTHSFESVGSHMI